MLVQNATVIKMVISMNVDRQRRNVTVLISIFHPTETLECQPRYFFFCFFFFVKSFFKHIFRESLQGFRVR